MSWVVVVVEMGCLKLVDEAESMCVDGCRGQKMKKRRKR